MKRSKTYICLTGQTNMNELRRIFNTNLTKLYINFVHRELTKVPPLTSGLSCSPYTGTSEQ